MGHIFEASWSINYLGAAGNDIQIYMYTVYLMFRGFLQVLAKIAVLVDQQLQLGYLIATGFWLGTVATSSFSHDFQNTEGEGHGRSAGVYEEQRCSKFWCGHLTPIWNYLDITQKWEQHETVAAKRQLKAPYPRVKERINTSQYSFWIFIKDGFRTQILVVYACARLPHARSRRCADGQNNANRLIICLPTS